MSNDRAPRQPPRINPATGRLLELGVPAHGVLDAYNDRDFPTRPQWTFTFYVAGELKQRVYHLRRAQEAWSRFAVDEPFAYDVTAVFEETPF